MDLARWFKFSWIRRKLAKRRRAVVWTPQNVDAERRRLLPFAAAVAALGISLGTSAKADTPFTSFSYPLSGAPTSQTTLARFAQLCYLATDYGIVGDAVTNNATNIQNLITKVYNTTLNSAIIYFPPGNYICNSQIDAGNPNSGETRLIIVGAGRNCSFINGAVNNGFIFSVADTNLGCPEVIADIGIANTSTVIGTGALFLNNCNYGRIQNCNLKGMICVLLPSNIFQMSIDNCNLETNSNVSTGHTGTFGIAGIHCNVRSFHTTSSMQAAIQFSGANSAVIEGGGIENCTCAWVAGMATGWASSCTVDNGTPGVAGDILHVGGSLGTTITQQFIVGGEVFMQGLTTTADWGISPVDANICKILSQISGTPGGAGDYQISRTANISSPVPCVTRWMTTMSGTHFRSVTSEGCYYVGFVQGLAGCSVANCGGSSNLTECVNPFGNGTGFTSVVGIYIYGGCSMDFTSCGLSNVVSLAEWYFDPNGAASQITFENCTGKKDIDTITGTSSSITNGSSGAGHILNVVSTTQGPFVGIGMRVFVGGVQVTTVDGNHATDGTLTGVGGNGTYHVADALNITGQVITIKTGDDIIMPTASAAKTGLQFINCNTPNAPAGYIPGWGLLNRTFTSLPGQAGANTNYPAAAGQSYFITDGAKFGGGTALPGDQVQGGGSQKIYVYYDGTSWIRD